MVITYFGKAYFKLTLGDLTIAINPPSKLSKPARFGADIALVTTNHSDYNDPETVTLGDTVPFVIDGPGSYEVHDILFTGAPSEVSIGGKVYINTVYGFELDGIKIAVLGMLAEEKTLSTEAKEIAASADMLFVPIGGDTVFDPATAYKVATSFGPNVIIPYAYDEGSLQRFLKEGSQEKNEAQDKATLKRRDLDGKEGYILVLTPQA
jgi:L-ascorbate metabolism protein UlaG (beta-lactamase superfamily)